MTGTMKTALGTALLVLVGLSCAAPSLAREPVNLDFRKQEIVRYHDSGAYDVDVHEVIVRARAYLGQRAAENSREGGNAKLALVLDIDETSLSNWGSLVRLEFGGTPETIADRIDLGKDPAIPETLGLYRYAVSLGVPVFFITGRHERLRAATEKNLRAVGYEQWEQLFMKPDDYEKKSVIPFKSGARKEIEDKGYRIIVNVGDQYSDLAGGHAERVFKLPDPFYYIP